MKTFSFIYKVSLQLFHKNFDITENNEPNDFSFDTFFLYRYTLCQEETMFSFSAKMIINKNKRE